VDQIEHPADPEDQGHPDCGQDVSVPVKSPLTKTWRAASILPSKREDDVIFAVHPRDHYSTECAFAPQSLVAAIEQVCACYTRKFSMGEGSGHAVSIEGAGRSSGLYEHHERIVRQSATVAYG